MATEKARDLQRRLRKLGLSAEAIQAAWPRWWSDEADGSASASADLRFTVARNLGLDPRSLFDPDQPPRFVWREQARFKHLTGEDEAELQAITSFGKALGALLVGGGLVVEALTSPSASSLREAILAGNVPYVRLIDLLSASWALGIPVIHLRIFPADQKRMAAMTVRVQDRYAILLAKDSLYPAQVAFYLSHELGHILLGDLASGDAVVDFDQAEPTLGGEDDEEDAADRFALELLTGQQAPLVVGSTSNPTGRSLAQATIDAANELRIEPGTLALCFGYSSGNWPAVMTSFRHIYPKPSPVWREVNQVALNELARAEIPSDARDYLDAVLGVSSV